MDIKLLLSIHNKPWLIEPGAASQLLDVWTQIREGNISSLHEAGEKKEGSVFSLAANVTVAPTTNWERQQFKGFNSPVAIIPVTGPLMKSDFCGDLGTASMQNLARQAADSPAVQCIVFMMDTPGGTVDGTQSFANTIAGIDKRTVCLVDGMMASAGYWIGSHCDEVYASDTTNFIGSIGTMCSLYDDSSYMEKEGIVLREYYATASKDKNNAIGEAIKGDGKKLVEEILDPLNNEFLSAVKSRRPDIKKEALSGKIYTAKTAMEMGLIDGIKNIDEILSTTSSTQTSKTKVNMKASELKASHPETYNEIFALGRTEGVSAGQTAEKDRVIGWQAWSHVDPEYVQKGIDGGAEVSSKDISVLSAKAASKTKIGAVEVDNAPKLDLPANQENKTPEDLELEANAAELLRMINGK